VLKLKKFDWCYKPAKKALITIPHV